MALKRHLKIIGIKELMLAIVYKQHVVVVCVEARHPCDFGSRIKCVVFYNGEG